MSRFVVKTNLYFENFSTVFYNKVTVPNLTVSLKITEYVKKNETAFMPYTISEDQKRPDLVSLDVYGNPFYDWTIILVNNILSDNL